MHFEQIDLKVPRTTVDTLARYGSRAVARRKFNKAKFNSLSEVAALLKPLYPDDGREEVVYVGPQLITPEELEELSNQDGGSYLTWINSYQPIKDQFFSTASTIDEHGNPTEGQRMYKGQWRLKDIKQGLQGGEQYKRIQKNGSISERGHIDIVLNEKCVWEGIGIIIFPDGSTYHG